MKNISVLILSGLLSLGSIAAAAPLVYDGFDNYTVDTTVVGQGPTTTGFTGNWTNNGGGLASGTVDYEPRSGGLSYSGYAPNSNGLLETYRASGSHSGGAKSVTRDFGTYTVSDTQDMYISFLFDNNSTSADTVTEFRFVAATSTDNNRDSRLLIDHSTGNVTFTAGGGDGTSHSETGLSGTNLLVVRAIDDSSGGNPNSAYYDAIEIWINPSLNSSASPTAADLGAPDAAGFGIMRNFTGGSALPYGRFQFLHELNSGNVQGDEVVVTHDLSDIIAIPEPGTLVLVGIALGSLLCFRRRK